MHDVSAGFCDLEAFAFSCFSLKRNSRHRAPHIFQSYPIFISLLFLLGEEHEQDTLITQPNQSTHRRNGMCYWSLFLALFDRKRRISSLRESVLLRKDRVTLLLCSIGSSHTRLPLPLPALQTLIAEAQHHIFCFLKIQNQKTAWTLTIMDIPNTVSNHSRFAGRLPAGTEQHVVIKKDGNKHVSTY